MLSFLPPKIASAAQIELPHLAAEKPVGPLCPLLAGVVPLAVDRVHRKKVRMLFGQRFHLPLGEVQCGTVGRKLLRVWHEPYLSEFFRYGFARRTADRPCTARRGH